MIIDQFFVIFIFNILLKNDEFMVFSLGKKYGNEQRLVS